MYPAPRRETREPAVGRPFGSSILRTRTAYTCTDFAALGGGSVPHNASKMLSTGTTLLARDSSNPRSRRSLTPLIANGSHLKRPEHTKPHLPSVSCVPLSTAITLSRCARSKAHPAKCRDRCRRGRTAAATPPALPEYSRSPGWGRGVG